MSSKKPKFTWHYYFMALGALGAMLAATLSAWSALVCAIAFALLSHPVLPFKALTRTVFLVMFFILYGFAFPDANVVQEMMSASPTG